jgi:hypothetical protein
MITAGVSRVASGLLCVHAIAITPTGPMELVRSSLSIVSGLPCEKVRSAPAIVVSGPAQRSLSLWPARSPSRLATLYIESSDSFVASAAVSIVTGWNEPVPGRELHPLKSSAFHGALFQQLWTTKLMASGFKLLRGIKRPRRRNQLRYDCAAQFVPNAFERCRQALKLPRTVVLELGF